MDKTKLADFTAEEEAQWENVKMLNSEANALFSSKSKWFKFSEYEIMAHPQYNGMLCIVPKKGASMKKYVPSNEFPTILTDFMEMLLQLSEINLSLAKIDGNLMRKCAEILLIFINKWGLFGHFFEYVESINFTKIKSQKAIIVNLKATPLSPKYYEIKDKIIGHTVDYETYASLFLPRLNRPYPNPIPGMGKTDIFYSNYGEPVAYIINHPILIKLITHLGIYKEFISGNYRLNDKFPEDNAHTWSDMLKIEPDYYGVGLLPEDNKYKLQWTYRSLLQALSNMYLRNLADEMGQKVNICQLPECNKAFIVKGNQTKYCCTNHGNRDRKRKERSQKK